MRTLSPVIALIAFCLVAAPIQAGFRLGRALQSSQTSGAQPPATAQSEQKQDEPIRLSSKLVLVPVSASDSSGNPVTNLTTSDIVIAENDKPQQVVSLGDPGKTPLDIALLFDVSGSTQKQFDFEQQAAVRFVKEDLKPTDGISLFAIGLTPRMVLARTAEKDQAINGIMSIKPSNEPTAFFDAIVQAVHYLDQTADSGSRRVVLVISDGEENYSKTSQLADALKALEQNDCVLYSINPNGGGVTMNRVSQQGEAVMEDMASQTGGKAFVPARIEDLDSVFNQIADELKAQYLFGYYANDESADGGFRRITVRAPKRPDLRLRARQGYYAPKP
ncbi:MAG TPA: VWA domain-containing protein [Blastocatellia bacterium]